MKRETERYLNRATRGLWGAARRDARRELRGAVEDRIHRHRLLGLSETDATHATLRDLGNPHAIARDLSRVHSLPHAARAALLASVAILLGMQALAQVPTVNAASSTPLPSCILNTAALQKLPAAQGAWLQAELAKPGGRDRLEAHCRDSRQPNNLLKLSDIIAALTLGGVNVQVLEGTDAFLSLQFPGNTERQPLNLNDFIREVRGERYIAVGNLLGQLNHVVKAPVRLTGLKNPTLEIGPARMQLGTEDQSVYSTDLYTGLIWNRISMELQFAAPDPSEMREMVAFSENGAMDSPTPALSFSIPDAEGGMYALVYSQTSTDRNAPSFALRAVKAGRVMFPSVWWTGTQPTLPRVVQTLPEFFKARSAGQPVALLYRLDTTNLRDLKLTLVPAAQVRLTPPRP